VCKQEQEQHVEKGFCFNKIATILICKILKHECCMVAIISMLTEYGLKVKTTLTNKELIISPYLS